MFEVEQKFRVDGFQSVECGIQELGGQFHPAETQIDLYFAHPSRDFAITDEAFRIRRVGRANFMTYKGPKIDATTKTRREIELPLPDGEDVCARYVELLAALGFAPVAEVRKDRRVAIVPWSGWQIHVALDDVTELGPFVELEISADEHSVEAARQCLALLAKRLGLEHNERRSYLELCHGLNSRRDTFDGRVEQLD